MLIEHGQDNALALSDQVDLIIAENRRRLHSVELRFSEFCRKQQGALYSTVVHIEGIRTSEWPMGFRALKLP